MGHHRLLDGLDGDMDSTSGFLGGTLGRVNQMVNSGRGNRKIMCYVILGVIMFAFILYSGSTEFFHPQATARNHRNFDGRR